jgi:two-component system sensor histidine kinase KdpD
VQISIRDRGQGLAAGDEQRVFDRFYRADTSLVGAGLGLSICKGIVDAHGGKIWAESRAGGGAIFNFTLPIEGNPPQMPALDGD